jgi:hypothetical protein
MNNNANTWIEGDGTVRTVLRKMALAEYCTIDRSRQQLLNAVGKDNEFLGTFLLQYAINRRKLEIQWISLYLPLLAFVCTAGFLLRGAIVSPSSLHVWVATGLIVSLAIIYRQTFFAQYLDGCRTLYLAGDDLAEKGNAKQPPSTPIEAETLPFVDASTETLKPACEAVSTMEVEQVSLTSAEIMQSEAELLDTQGRDVEIAEGPNKGSINTILLHELVKKEAGRPNIHNGDVHKAVLYYAQITGCKPKNILDKTKYYKKRDAIVLNTPNARTTHKKYLDILLQYYAEIGDDALYNTAEDLQSFIERTAIRKK